MLSFKQRHYLLIIKREPFAVTLCWSGRAVWFILIFSCQKNIVVVSFGESFDKLKTWSNYFQNTFTLKKHFSRNMFNNLEVRRGLACFSFQVWRFYSRGRADVLCALCSPCGLYATLFSEISLERWLIIKLRFFRRALCKIRDFDAKTASN